MATEKDAEREQNASSDDEENSSLYQRVGRSLSEIEEEMASPRPGGHFFDQFNPDPPTLTEGPDGMPMEVDPPWNPEDAAPIPLSHKTVACLAQPGCAFFPRGLAKCSHYKRQRVHSPATPDRPLIMRFCCRGELKGLNGAALVIDDAGIFNCEFRHPPDPRTELVLDQIDDGIIKKGEERLKIEKETGHIHGYRMFPTMEDYKAGRRTVDEGDYAKPADALGKDE